MKLKNSFSVAYLEYAICTESYILACSLFDRSSQTIKSVTATATSGGLLTISDMGRDVIRRSMGWEAGADSYVAPMKIGKERVTHALCVSRIIGTGGLLTTKERKLQDVYNYLMAHFKLPLLFEWIEEILKKVSERYGYTEKVKIYRSYYDNEMFFPLGNERVNINDLIFVPVSLEESDLENIIQELFKERKIKISETPQKPLAFKDMDEYFNIYGSGVMGNLKKLLNPVSEHTDRMEYAALKKLRLYPQQISIDNGIINYFRKKKGKYAFFNCGMGTGKTIMGATAVEGFFNSKAMDIQKKSLAEILKEPGAVTYRNIVMCPSHLVNKWVKEIKEQIPHTNAIALTDFKQLLEIKANGRARTGKEWYVISKDFGKLSYMERPAVKRIKKGEIVSCCCSECNNEKSNSYKGNNCQCEGCEGKYVPVSREIGNVIGLCCPSCGRILCTPARKDGDGYKYHLDVYDFLEKNRWNDHCWFCDEPLWEPHVRNLGETEGSRKNKTWHRVTHYANKAKKAKKTVWLLSGTENRYFRQIEMDMLNDLGDEGGCRKYAPASYIKKQLRGFFDFALFDEVHQYKGGGTAQGNAMHALIKASKYQLGLTGTIAGGVATHLFSLLFRLDPKRMLDKGFKHNSEIAFAEQYGTIETVYDAVESYRSNKMSKGKQLASPKVKPGISPKVFTDFLMDKAVFLDLSDMSKFLPPLKEKVVIVNTEPEVVQEYNNVTGRLKEEARTKGGHGLLGSMLQFSLSYADKPYGVGPVIHPNTGKEVIKPADLSYLTERGLLNKESELIRIINKEISEDRNVVVYAEYTNSEETCVTERLKDIIERNCGLYGQVQIIKASSPEAIKREAWLHEKAASGIRVFITNPKILETGVDLCFTHKDVAYNYPTLIFYQLGYSLFTIWQASRRHYRLCQKRECRTYYMASKSTVQPAVIKLIAAKQVATSAIQGKFSAEGLAAMAEGVDTRLILAKALADRDTENQDELQQMFDVLADTSDDTEVSYVPMSTYYELVGEEEPAKEIPLVPYVADLAFGMGFLDDDFDLFNLNFEPTVFVPVISEDKKQTKNNTSDDGGEKTRIKVRGAGNSYSLFDFI